MSNTAGLKAELKEVEELAKIPAHLSADEAKGFRDSFIRTKTVQTTLRKDQLRDEISQCVDKEKTIKEEKMKRGNVSEWFTLENLLRVFLLGCLLPFGFAGEFCLFHYTIEPFDLGKLETNLVALMLTFITLEGMNYYITSLRKKFPTLEDHLFLILGCAAFFLLVMITLLGADIREKLFHLSTLKSLASSPEEIVRVVEDFYKGVAKSFMALMVCLSISVMIVSGLSWHDLRNRFFSAVTLLSLHMAHEAIRRQMQRFKQEITDLDIWLQEILFAFDAAYSREKAFPSQGRGASGNIFSRSNSSQDGVKVWKLISLTILLIVLVLVLFFAFRGVARSESIIGFDLSQSMGVSNYTGNETETQQNSKAVEAYIQNNASPGERLIIFGITERTHSTPYILLEGTISTRQGAFGQEVARSKMELLKQWRSHQLKPIAPQTDLFGAMQLAEILFTKNFRDKKLILLSDLRQYGQGFDFESPQVLDANRLFKEVMQKGLVASLDGTTVWCLGVHGAGKTPTYWKSLREFWTLYFQQAKVKELKAFTPERRFSNE